MKVRWREHEMIFVTILAVSQIIFSFFEQGSLAIFQAMSILLFCVAYMTLNLLITPSIKKISFNDVERVFALNILKPFLLIISVSYLLAIGVNAISFYVLPHTVNYANYQLLAWLGYNDRPLANLLFGFNRAIGIVMLFVALAGIRELVIWLIERPGVKRAFRVMVINNLTPLLLVYFLIPSFIDPLHAQFMDYLAWTTPVLALYIYDTFWLFPFTERYSWRQRPVLLRLSISTFAGALFYAIVYSGRDKLIGFLMYWLFLLAVVTLLVWLLYQQRKDKIIQLKGLETALARSTTDLQFLRSQINPHFLFNALNTLYGTALRERSEQTASGIQMLGDMMRFMLHDNNQDLIPMSKEVEYLKNYIALQKLRTAPSPHIRIQENIDEVQCRQQIAPMLLIPFVENAFKHGISLKDKSWIDIKLECAETFICFEVRNSIHGRREDYFEKDKSGIGLNNVRERLHLLYPGKHELEVSENGNEFRAKLVIK